MICGRCGVNNNGGIRYCTNCGGQLSTTAQPAYAAAAGAQAMPPAVPARYAPPSPPPMYAAVAPPPPAYGAVLPPQAGYPYATAGVAPRYANFFARFFALVIDEFLAGALVSVVLGVFSAIFYLMFVAGVLTNNAGTGIFSGVMFWVMGFPMAAAAYVLYFVMQETGPNQATLGKRMLNMKVTDMNGGAITVGQSLGRLLVKNLLSDLIFGLGFFMAAFTERKQALHDMAASTLVLER